MTVSPKNKCWECGKYLVVNVKGKGCQRVYDTHSSKIYGYACKPYCIAIDDGEKI